MPEIINTILEFEDAIVGFRIEQLPISEEHVYAVYCIYKGQNYCFHMMYDPPALEFKIVDNRNCPDVIRQWAFMLSKAIEDFHL